MGAVPGNVAGKGSVGDQREKFHWEESDDIIA